MNPIIYACWSKDFRRAFRKLLCSCFISNSNLSYNRNRIYKAPGNRYNYYYKSKIKHQQQQQQLQHQPQKANLAEPSPPEKDDDDDEEMIGETIEQFHLENGEHNDCSPKRPPTLRNLFTNRFKRSSSFNCETVAKRVEHKQSSSLNFTVHKSSANKNSKHTNDDKWHKRNDASYNTIFQIANTHNVPT